MEVPKQGLNPILNLWHYKGIPAFTSEETKPGRKIAVLQKFQEKQAKKWQVRNYI